MAIDINYSNDMIASTLNGIELVSGLINAYNEANGAFARANSVGGVNSITFDTDSTHPGLTVNSGVTFTMTSNGIVLFGANSSTTGQVGVVQLNDTITSTSTSLAATANSVKIVNDAASGAFIHANSHDSIISSAYARANTLDGIGSLTLTGTGGVAVGGGSTSTLTANGTIAITANSATTLVVGVVQLNDTTLSTSTTQAATANAVNTVWAYAQSAYAQANTGGSGGSVAKTGDVMSGMLTTPSLTANIGVNTGIIFANSFITAAGNVTGQNFTTTGVVNSAAVMINTVNVGGTYILSPKDSGTVIFFNNSNPVTVNTSTTLFPGFRVVLTQVNTGLVTVQAGAGTQVIPRIVGNNSISAQNNSVVLLSWAQNTFLLDGSVASPITTATINDTLISTSTSQALSANMGNYLNSTSVNNTGGTITGSLIVTANLTSGNLNTTGVVNTQITSVTSITTATPNYVLSLRDSGQIIAYSNTIDLQVNIGSGIALPVGFRVAFLQANTGNVNFVANGVNLFSRIGVSMATIAQYGCATLFCYSSNNFILSGEIN